MRQLIPVSVVAAAVVLLAIIASDKRVRHGTAAQTDVKQLERRVSALEEDVAALKARVAALPAAPAPAAAKPKPGEARVAAARVDLAAIEVALDAFEVDVGRYPTNEEGLKALVAQPAGVKNWRGPYLKRLPDDPWGHPYLYRFPGQHNKNDYDLASAGPDGKPGGGDDPGNWDNDR